MLESNKVNIFRFLPTPNLMPTINCHRKNAEDWTEKKIKFPATKFKISIPTKFNNNFLFSFFLHQPKFSFTFSLLYFINCFVSFPMHFHLSLIDKLAYCFSSFTFYFWKEDRIISKKIFSFIKYHSLFLEILTSLVASFSSFQN